MLSDRKKNKLLELVTTGAITTANFKSMTAACDKEAEEAQKILSELEKQIFTKDEYRKHLAEVRERLDAAVRDAETGMITNEFVARYIDRITVTPEENGAARLEIKIFTGKSTGKYLQKLKSRASPPPTSVRAGVIMKKMIEKYENDLKNGNR